MSSPDAIPQTTAHARIDRGTQRIVLPVPAKGTSTFAIAGKWFDEDHGESMVTLVCLTTKASRKSEHRLIRDAEFPLPDGTNQIEVLVNMSTPSTDLLVTVSTTPPPPPRHPRAATSAHR